MAPPPSHFQPQQDEDDKSVMKVTVVSCKGPRPSENVIDVSIDGNKSLTPNAKTPQIDKILRRLTKNVIKIQNEIEHQNNPHSKQIDSTNESHTDSGSQDTESTERGKHLLNTTKKPRVREASITPHCHHQNKIAPAIEVPRNMCCNSTSHKGNSNGPPKYTSSNSDIVEIYSNKLTHESCDSMFTNEMMRHEVRGLRTSLNGQNFCRKRSLSCSNIAHQPRNAIQVYPVNLPGKSGTPFDNGGGQENNIETDSCSLSSESIENNSMCSCRHYHALDTVHAPGEIDMQLGRNTSASSVLSYSVFSKCLGPTHTRRKTTGIKSGHNKDPADKESAVTGGSKDSRGPILTGLNSKDGKAAAESDSSGGKSGKSDQKRDDQIEKLILEKQKALANEINKNNLLSKQTEEQNKKISELNKKLDELNKKNAELNRQTTGEKIKREEERQREEECKRDERKREEEREKEERKREEERKRDERKRDERKRDEERIREERKREQERQREEERWREEDACQMESERNQTENASLLQNNYPREGQKRRVKIITKGKKTNIEALEEILHSKLQPTNLNNLSPGLNSRRNGSPSLNRGYASQRNQSSYSPVSRDTKATDNQPSFSDDYYNRRDQSRGLGSTNGPNYDFYRDRCRGPDSWENQSKGQAYDPGYAYPREGYQGMANMNNIPGPWDTPKVPGTQAACENCGSSDQNITFCCCCKKKPKQKAKSRPASPQRACPCCGQSPARCICEKGDLAPISLYQNASMPNIPIQIGDGIYPSRDLMPKDRMKPSGYLSKINAPLDNVLDEPGAGENKSQGSVLKYLCYCSNDSQETIHPPEVITPEEGDNGTEKSPVDDCRLDKAKSVAFNENGAEKKEDNLQQMDGHTDGPSSPEVSCDSQGDNEKMGKLVQQMLGCVCDKPPTEETVQEKFSGKSKKNRLVQQMISCACYEPKAEDYPSEKILSIKTYEEQHYDDKKIDTFPCGSDDRGKQDKVDEQKKHSCACADAKRSEDMHGKQNAVERRLDRHGFGNRNDCGKKRSLIQSRLACVCNGDETNETLRKQKIIERHIGCKGDPFCDPKKMGEHVRTSLTCGASCDEHAVRETRRKQAIVERRINCTADNLRDTGKKSAYLKQRLDCVCDDGETRAKKQQAYLERFLTCGCTNVERDVQKKKQFVDEFLKCKCDKESEVKKMQMYLERLLSCDCEHTKERNVDKKIDYMNKVLSCDGASCKAEKEGKELVTVCGDVQADVAEVTKRLPVDMPRLGSNALLCCCGSGEGSLRPCRCDSMTDVEKSCGRRDGNRSSTSIAGGLICKCGKEGDSACVCDGVKKPPAKLLSGPKASCKCRDRLDGICRCQDKTGKNVNPNARRSYMIQQVPCDKAAKKSAIAESGSDQILCSAKKTDCNCELDPESCFCSENVSKKPETVLNEGNSIDDNVVLTYTSKTTKQPSETAEVPETAEEVSAAEDNQDDEQQNEKQPDQISADETSEAGIREGEQEDDCLCKQNCFGKCKCDIDGSDCRQGKQARRCYCDVDGPESCICDGKKTRRQVSAQGTSAQGTSAQGTSAQGTCYCIKDETGRCECDFAGKDPMRSGSQHEESGTCFCKKDASGMCKCDKGASVTKVTNEQGIRKSGIVIELKNINSSPEVKISGLETGKGNLKVIKSDAPIIEKRDASAHEKHPSGRESQVHFMELSPKDVFIIEKNPDFKELSSESCTESTDEASGSSINLSTGSKSSVYNVSISSELPQQSRDSQEEDVWNQKPFSTDKREKKSGPSLTLVKTVQTGPSRVDVQSVRVGPSLPEIQDRQVGTSSAGPSRVKDEARRPKWYNMFNLMSNKKNRKRRRRRKHSGDSGCSSES